MMRYIVYIYAHVEMVIGAWNNFKRKSKETKRKKELYSDMYPSCICNNNKQKKQAILK